MPRLTLGIWHQCLNHLGGSGGENHIPALVHFGVAAFARIKMTLSGSALHLLSGFGGLDALGC